MRAGIVICLCVGLSTAASAEWKVGLTVTGEPYDVKAWRPGTVAIAHSTGAELHIDEVPVAQVPFSPGIGTLLLSSGCFAGVGPDGTVFGQDACLPGGPLFEDFSQEYRIRRLMQTASGASYVVLGGDSSGLQVLTATPSGTPLFPWRRLVHASGFDLSTDVMGVTETAGNVPHALIVIIGPPNMYWIRDDKIEAQVSVPASLTTRIAQTVDLIPTSGPHPIALMGNADGLFRGQLQPSPIGTYLTPFAKVPLDGMGAVDIKSVDVNTEKGSGKGTGFGLAVGSRNGGEPVVLGAVPAASAAEAGTQWRVHPAFENASLPVTDPFHQVSCVDSTFCVITLKNQGQNVLYYFNAAAPRFAAIPDPVTINEGTLRTLDISASDPDFDAVRVSVETPPSLLSVDATPRVDGVTLSLSAPEVCESTTAQFFVHASDGLAAHDQRSTVTVRIENTEGPRPPVVTPLNATTSAGGAPIEFTASPGVGPCAPVDYTWSDEPGQPPLQKGALGRATFEPPAFVCSPTGARYTYSVKALDKGRQASMPTTMTVDVRPWGKPSAPFVSDAVRRLPSGGSLELRPESLHPCDGTQGLPVVETVWRLANGTPGLPSGLTVKNASGGAVDLSSPVSSPLLQVSSTACTGGGVTLSVRNRMAASGGGILEGPESRVRVEVDFVPEDVSSAKLDMLLHTEGSKDVQANLGTSLRCPGAHSLKARMFLESSDGTLLASDVVPVPGAWAFEFPAVCSDTPFTVRGELFAEGSPPIEAGRARQTLTAQARPVALGELEGEALVARCGVGATATLTQMIPPEACTDVKVSWEQEGGPALEHVELAGRQVTLETRETGLQELVGESVAVRVTADGGGGNRAVRRHSLPIIAEPFVDVAHSSEAVSGQETGLVGVVVELSNTTACAVTGLRFVESLEGMDLVPGSVKLAGQSVVARPIEGGFQVEGLSLPAHGGSTLTYVARPGLLSSPRFSGEVFLNGVPVAGRSRREPSSSCGCSQGSSGAALMGLLAVARLLRRRRGGGARA
ncbi:hypothetical protein NVS55_24450 [Myxococcus stipitatus]|uniref:hypothetical protein n=1 Tax=Myxococcus stipitatus TaxID=83455 RepID=UPI0031453ECA